MKPIKTNVVVKSNLDEFQKAIDELKQAIQKVNDFELEFEIVRNKE